MLGRRCSILKTAIFIHFITRTVLRASGFFRRNSNDSICAVRRTDRWRRTSLLLIRLILSSRPYFPTFRCGSFYTRWLNLRMNTGRRSGWKSCPTGGFFFFLFASIFFYSLAFRLESVRDGFQRIASWLNLAFPGNGRITFATLKPSLMLRGGVNPLTQRSSRSP